MNLEDYCSAILEQYPEYITKEQMYRICHISKRTCLFLLESGLVQNIDSGKKTRRFKIKTVDVIQYLKTRDKEPARFQVPNGYYSSTNAEQSGEEFLPHYEEIPPEAVACMRRFYEKHLAKYPDVMSVGQVAKFTGYCTNSVGRWCSKEQLKCFLIKRRFYISKEYLVEFLLSRDFIGIVVKSDEHKKINKLLRQIVIEANL